jgi:hypothetical protein
MAKAKPKAKASPAKRPVGRPSSYDPAYCEGASPEEIAVELGVNRATMIMWGEAHPDFLTALERAKDLELVWWERIGKRALFADKFQQQVWSKSMQARFRHKYTEQQVTTLQGPNGGPINTKTEFTINLVAAPSKDNIV